MRNLFKNIIISNQERLKQIVVKHREYSVEKNGNYVFVGLRRAGKTFFLYQQIKQRLKNSQLDRVLYINFEDERLLNFDYRNLYLLIECYKELYNQKPEVYLDEVQNVQHWEKFVRRLADEDYKVMVTGSNSEMLSSEIATILGGRFIIKEILPLSFNEYLQFNDIKLKKHFEFSEQLYQVKELYNDYLHYGGFPELNKFANKREYLSNLYQKLFFGDVVARYSIDNVMVLKLLVKKLAESVNNETSINRIKNLIQSVGIKVGNSTLFDYINYLENSYIIFEISNYANKFVERESKKKYYFSDTGILNLFLFDQKSKLLENLVYLYLHRNYNEPIYFFKRNIEVDFVIPEKQLVIQVAYSIANIETKQREVKSMLKVLKEMNLKQGYIITYDEDGVIEQDGFVINIVPCWELLLGLEQLK
jgi:predicted AAA+ superfamily ATPase